VQVLLATYNGERFLREQIDSILAQTLPGVSILARDDGSNDSTPQILEDYGRRSPDRFRILPTVTPTGSARDNFLALLHASEAPYIAFADQDDVWLPQKLERQMNAMHGLEQRYGTSTPLLVFSDLRVVSDDLTSIARPSGAIAESGHTTSIASAASSWKTSSRAARHCSTLLSSASPAPCRRPP
jgi:glycosyltransferase involved in cell wall biosynthesis